MIVPYPAGGPSDFFARKVQPDAMKCSARSVMRVLSKYAKLPVRTFTSVHSVRVTVAPAGTCDWARWMALPLSQIDSAVTDPA